MNKQLTFAVVGGGKVGQGALRYAAGRDDIRTTGVVEPDEAGRARLAAAYDVPVYDSLEALLASKPDCVKICSPNAMHAEQSVQCLEHGANVLVEKPMATRLEDCRRMVDAENAAGKVLLVNFEYRISAVFAKVRELVAEGAIGTVRNVFLYESRGPFWGAKGSWRYTKEGAGGIVSEKLVHYIDLMRFFTGAPVTQVNGFHGPNTISHYEFADNGFLIMRHRNGAQSVIGTFHGVQPDWCFEEYPDKHDVNTDLGARREAFIARYGHRDFLQITGTEGSIDADMVHATVATCRYVPCDARGGQATKAGPHFDFSHLPWAETIHNQTGMLDHFFACVHGNAEPCVPSAEALESMAATFAAETALEEQKGVEVDI